MEARVLPPPATQGRAHLPGGRAAGEGHTRPKPGCQEIKIPAEYLCGLECVSPSRPTPLICNAWVITPVQALNEMLNVKMTHKL